MLRTFSLALLAASALAGAASAQTPGRFAVGVQAGTTGLGAEGQFQASDMLTLRAGGDVFKYEDEFSSDDLQYEGDADFTTVSAFVDLHPFRNGLFVSAGVFAGERKIQVTGTPERDVIIQGQVFPPSRFGSLVGEADFGSTAPFVGVGFNNTFRTRGPIGFKAMVGAAFGEDPNVELRRQGGEALPAQFQTSFDAELREQETQLESDIEEFKTLPVVQLGLTYRF